MEAIQLNHSEILEYQKNRFPYLMIDMATEVIPGESAKGFKNLTSNDWFFECHFEGDPNMPGMLQVEALVQMSALSVLTLPENKGKVVLTKDEYDQVNLMAESVKAHPSAKYLLDLAGDCESSVFVKDRETGVELKCRPDKDCVESANIIIDVKTTSNIDDWRSDKEWVNPLYKFNYGHGASFYTDVLEQHYNTTIDSFVFLVIQNSVVLNRYPVAVFQISRSELIDLGFWDRHRTNVFEYSRCKSQNDWVHTESFNFGGWSDDFVTDDLTVTFEGENNA